MSPSEFDELTRGGTRELGFGSTAAGALWMMISSASGARTLPLPSRGSLVFGRTPDCEVFIDEPQISRRHAVLHVGDSIEIEDLGSRNGTRVRGELVPVGTRLRIGAGDVVNLGTTVIVFQSAPTERPRRILAHGYFELYLEGECARAAAGGAPFAMARMRVGDAASEAVEHLLALGLSPIDQFASYAPGEYEILMLRVDRAVAESRLAKIVDTFRPLGIEPRLGLAVYPEQGRTPEEIAGAAAPHHPNDDRAVSPTTIERLQPLVDRVAAGQINVLILGETGVGKEVMSQTLHDRSPRASAPMLSLNCAALSETLLESELFGYERGAFTGAVAAKPGLLETAAGGTVFLDEIGEMPLAVQAKLLRVIEQKQVLRIGALKPRAIDVRFVAATHRDLEEEVARGRFRQDLYFRLNAISLVIPPLRERVDEIPQLAARFAEHAARQLNGGAAPRFAADAMQLLRAYSWPGNIRELRNVVERAVLLCNGGVITASEIPSEKMGRTLAPRSASSAQLPAAPLPARRSNPTAAMPAVALPPTQGSSLDEVTGTTQAGDEAKERARIVAALAQCGGNQTQAAKVLGISRRTLVYRLSTYDLPRPRRRP